jgi:hypothetical protein
LNHLDLIFTIRGLYSYQDFQLLNTPSGRVGDIFRGRILHPSGTELGCSEPGVNAGAETRLCHTTSTTSPRPHRFSPFITTPSLCFILETWSDSDLQKPWTSAPAVGSSTSTNSTPRIRIPNASNSRLWLSQPRKGVPSANLSMITNRRIIQPGK